MQLNPITPEFNLKSGDFVVIDPKYIHDSDTWNKNIKYPHVLRVHSVMGYENSFSLYCTIANDVYNTVRRVEIFQLLGILSLNDQVEVGQQLSDYNSTLIVEEILNDYIIMRAGESSTKKCISRSNMVDISTGKPVFSKELSSELISVWNKSLPQ